MVETIKINRLRWLGHVTWMSDDRLPKKLFVWEDPYTKRPRGRPRNRWKDEVYKDAERLDKNWKGAINNRNSWRRLLRMARNHRILQSPNEWMNEWMNEWKQNFGLLHKYFNSSTFSKELLLFSTLWLFCILISRHDHVHSQNFRNV